jgi:hypothetical protein
VTTIRAGHYSPKHAVLRQMAVGSVMSTGGGLKPFGSGVDVDPVNIPQARASSWTSQCLGTLKHAGRFVTCAPSTAHSFSRFYTVLPTGAGGVDLEVNEYEHNDLLHWVAKTNEALSAVPAAAKVAPKQTETATATLRVTRLVGLQAVLGLATSELADVLRITRQGLYKWLDASKELKLQGGNRERLALIERIAKKWHDRSNAPLSKVVHEPLSAGDTAFARLMAEVIDEASFDSIFDELLAKLNAKPLSLSQRLAAAGFERRPSLRSVPDDDE